MFQPSKFLPALVASVSVTACQMQLPGHGPTTAVLRTQSSAQQEVDYKRDYSKELKALLPKTPYKGEVRLSVDTGLLGGKAGRKLFSLSNKHQGNDQHRDNGQYFNPNTPGATVDVHLGDKKGSEDIGYIAGVSINGDTTEVVSDLIQLKLKEGSEAKLDELKAKYGLEVLGLEDGNLFAKVTLGKAQVSTLLGNLERYNTYAPDPIKDINFSSIASAQASAIFFDMLMNHGTDLEYLLPVEIPKAPFVRSDESILPTYHVPPLAGSPGYDVTYVNTVEGMNRRGDQQRSFNISWLKAIKASEAWTHSIGRGVRVAVIDGGFNRDGIVDVPSSRIVAKRNFYRPQITGNEPYLHWPFTDAYNDPSHAFHGSFAYSTIAGGHDDLKGGVGVAPAVDLILARAFTPWDTYNAVKWAINSENRASVIVQDEDLQLSRYAKTAAIALMIPLIIVGAVIPLEFALRAAIGAEFDAVRMATNANIPFIAPAGNSGFKISKVFHPQFLFLLEENFVFPACLPEVITAGGSEPGADFRYGQYWDDGDERSQSNYGSAVDVYAPATSVYISTINGFQNDHSLEQDRDLWNFGGTSSAGPIVAGVVALMRGRDPNISTTEIKRRLALAATTYIRDPDGRLTPHVNAEGAVKDLYSDRHSSGISEVRGHLVQVGGVNKFIRDDVCPSTTITLDPNFAPDPRNPQLTVAGWYHRENSSLFEALIIRERSSVSPVVCSTPTPYRVRGYLSDASSGGSLAHVEVELRPGVQACDANVIARTRTDASGLYEFANVAEGNYTITINSSGLVNVCSNVTVNAANPNGSGTGNIVTTPVLPSNATRFVVTWGGAPNDLDSHLTGPDGVGGRFHVYYANRSFQNSNVDVSLDVDDTNGFGPETITNTIYASRPGTFRYAIHDFSNRNNASSTALSNSGAQVLVFRGSQLLQSISLNPGASGTVWNVLEMDGSTGAITPINRMTSESDPAYVIQGLRNGFSEFTNLLKRTPEK